MAKKKRVLKTKRRIAKRKKRSGLSVPLIAISVIFIIILLTSFRLIVSRSKSGTLPRKEASTTLKATKSAALITPYPTISQKPTPVPLTGFCLHVPILTYHHVQPEKDAKELGQTSLTVDNVIFDQQMSYLIASGYTPIWVNDLMNALISHSQLPGKPIVVTMDDGYADNLTYALPILQKYNIKANIMLASGLMNNPDFLSWDQVRELKQSGLIYFTNHTWSHYAINTGAQVKIEQEIDVAQSEMQSQTGQPVNIFTYPYGAFNENAIQTLQRKGYVGALGTIPGQYQCDSFIMTLHRTHIGNAPLSAYGI